ncbi:glycoside hydrolase family 1 protein [Candidatus Mycoplasma mahonii]|uniref:glycoside hydrolase family 1 protein n=1 Tax=Candidatus Mycoplasma mahonii TaxID=3004105 RepID=UPI0026EAAECD|nr:glycoside hydrolase family 1 protein [Candidatus Mycoplasma mahonii]WKX02753.1 glycoside hydrolase family 1 protein [Candidatus Mycoplasma mahonii]
MTKTIKFPSNFMFGSATSGPQTEGGINMDGKTQSVWDYWYKNGGNFYDNKYVLGDARNRYKEYVQKAKETNFNSLRTSIQWTRLIPDGKNVSQDAVQFYKDYLQCIKNSGMKVLVNLMHFDMPLWLYEKGGFETKEAIDAYIYYAKICFEEFGHIVDYWFTFNEPIVPVEMGYFNKFHLPAIYDVKKGYQSLFNYLIAHLRSVELFKEMNLKSEIGIILNITPVIPRSDTEEDINSAKWASLFQYRSFLDPIIKGEFPQEIINHAKQNGYMWEMTNEEINIIKRNIGIDLLGLNYYTPKRTKEVVNKQSFNLYKPLEGQLYDDYEMPNRKINKHRGWEIFPEAIYLMIKNIQNNYNNQKMFIAENGIGIQNEEIWKKDGIIMDDYRIEFFKEHLHYVHKAISEGANCIGYHMWTYIDNWSWLNAYKNRYGLYSLDIKTGKISAKKSAKWYGELAKHGQYNE